MICTFGCGCRFDGTTNPVSVRWCLMHQTQLNETPAAERASTLEEAAEKMARRRNVQLFAPDGVIVEGVERADVEHLIEKMRARAVEKCRADLEAIGWPSAGSGERAGPWWHVMVTLGRSEDGYDVQLHPSAKGYPKVIAHCTDATDAANIAAALNQATPLAPEVGLQDGVYFASRTRHAARWRALRDSGYPVASTWIDEAGPGQTTDYADLMRRCIEEVKSAAAMIVYAEADDIAGWKGVWFEMGAACAAGVPVYFVGVPDFPSALHHPGVTFCESLNHATTLAQQVTPRRGRRNDEH